MQGSMGSEYGDDHPALVAKVKEGQRMSPEFKQRWWAYADATHNGIRDPAQHDTISLQIFLSELAASSLSSSSHPQYGSSSSGELSKEDLVERVKGIMRSGIQSKQQWWWFCATYGGRIRDPAKHPREFLQQFVDMYETGAEPSMEIKEPPKTRSDFGGKGQDGSGKGGYSFTYMDQWQLPSGKGQDASSKGGQQDGQFSGVVKSYKPEVGYGFIRCDETFQLFHSDVFLHEREFSGLEVGLEVSFRVHLNARGQPQANSVSAVGGAAKRARTEAPAWPGGLNSAPAGSLSAPEDFNSLPLVPQGPFIGTVKNFNAATGYGFIECSVTKDMFAQDVFLHQSQMMTGVDNGSSVSFQVRLNMRGQPQAENVLFLA